VGYVEAVDGGAFFGCDLGPKDVESRFCECLGDCVKEAEAVFGGDVNDGLGGGAVVVYGDAGGEAFAADGMIEGGADFLALDGGVEVNIGAFQSAVKELGALFDLFLGGGASGEGVGDVECVEGDAVLSAVDLGAEDVEAACAASAGDAAEEAGAVPGAEFEFSAAAVGEGGPVKDGLEGGHGAVEFFVRGVKDELVDEIEVEEDFAWGGALEIAGGHVLEMGKKFFFGDMVWELAG